ncbi:MAG: hypothetical protein NVS9B2_30750 [Steroidobacteraceae bacterium]
MQTPSEFEKAPKHETGLKFAQMSRNQKAVFVVKLLICIATFGFVFPNVQSD